MSSLPFKTHKVQWGEYHSVHIYTHMCCASLPAHVCASVFYKRLCIKATHSTQRIVTSTRRVLYRVLCEASELWYSPTEQLPVHVTLSNEPLPALGALLASIAVCSTQQLSTGGLVLWEQLAIPSTDGCLLTPCLMLQLFNSLSSHLLCKAVCNL